MERLTRNDMGYGHVVCRYDYEKCIDQEEDGGCEYCSHFSKILKKLCEYEDAEEQGLLLRLPCKVGDEVFIIGMKYRKGSFDKWINTGKFRISDLEYLGKTVFLTKAEAEKALEELQSK